MAQANENDEEVLEQLVQAAETGDVAILRTLLTDHHDLRGGGGVWPGTYSFECSALFRRRRVETRGELRENTYIQPPSPRVATPESPWVSSFEPKRDGHAAQNLRKLSKC